MCIKREEKELEIIPVAECEVPPEFKKFEYDQRIFNWIFLVFITHFCMAAYYLYLIPFGHMSFWTLPLGYVWAVSTAGLGTTVGAHRYWTHKSFKATKPLQYLMMLMQTSSMQFPLWQWCRNHRVHHKYTDTDADPYNSSRGFWFSHIGWLLLPKHPKLVEALKTIDISDLAKDPVVRFQAKYYWELVALMLFIVPSAILYMFFPELTLVHHVIGIFTIFGTNAHFTFLVNSVAHIWGDRPYDKYISPTDNKFVSLFAIGEGFHNYHHTFPWDYKAAEFGGYAFNFSTAFINFFARIGWAYDLKTVSHQLLRDRINRTGNETHPLHQHYGRENKTEENGNEVENIKAERGCWGWGDKTLDSKDVLITQTLFPSKTD